MYKVTIEEKKEEILKFVTEFSKKNGYPPTIREICKEFNFKSSSTGHMYLDRLKKDGLISSEEDKIRTWKVEKERYKKDSKVIALKEETISITFELDKPSLAILNEYCNKNGINGDEGLTRAIYELKKLM